MSPMLSSKRANVSFIAAAIAILGILGIGIVRAFQTADVVATNVSSDVESASTRSKSVVVGGVPRPERDIVKGRRPAREPDAVPQHEPTKGRTGYGQSPKLDPASSPAIEAVANAIKSGPASARPSMFSPMIAADSFNLAAYKRDSQSYLNSVEPGRVFQGAQPGEGVPVIKRVSSRKQKMLQGESVRLQVGVPAGAPVTFTSFDLGAFQNKLTSISVAANSEGIAEAVFTATSGTIAEVSILAASPMASGRVRFEVYIASPAQ